MIFFLIGYLAAAVVVYYEKEYILRIITGMVFFLGASFVSIVVRFGFLSINDFSRINDNLIKERNELTIAEKKVQELNKNLEKKVSERTLQLSEVVAKLSVSEEALKVKTVELEKNLKALQATNKELESFSYTTSHDLRQPVRAINGFINLIKKNYAEQMDAEGREYIETIVNESKTMGNLIEDMLKFLELGKCQVKKSTVNMFNLTTEVIQGMLKPDFNFDIKIKLEGMPSVTGDEELIRLALTNLISNAMKFAGPIKNPVIEIGTFFENTSIVYYVKDNGIGFDMKHYNKLFGIFQKIHTDKNIPGTGIGLAMVKKIIERQGGKVWAEGVPGKGATFYFSLPKQT